MVTTCRHKSRGKTRRDGGHLIYGAGVAWSTFPKFRSRFVIYYGPVQFGRHKSWDISLCQKRFNMFNLVDSEQFETAGVLFWGYGLTKIDKLLF